MMPKAKVYIDGANMFYTQKDIGFSIDWKKTKAYLQENYDILEIRYYVGIKENDEKMARYLRYLDAIHFAVITKPMKVIKIDHNHPMAKLHNYSKIYKCNFDVEMTTDILLDRVNIDEIILFSGDSDFNYLIKKLYSLGKKVEIFSSRKMLAWELKFSGAKYHFLEDLRNSIERK
jgi:uncharacterized LabA/DUF88 family protein